jgi:hypothetical protein
VPLVVTEGNYLLLESDARPAARACIDEVWFLAPTPTFATLGWCADHERGKSPEDAAFWALGPTSAMPN